MNLARILEQSADELPRVHLRKGPPRLHPRLVVREHQERDDKVYTLLIPGGRPPHYFRLNEMQYRIVTLFNGERMPEDVVQVAKSTLGISLTLDDVEKFVRMMDDGQFWYRTPQEESVALCEQLMEKRQQRLKKDYGDLSKIILWSFDPDRAVTWVNKHFGWIYSRWFSIWSVFMLVVALIILGSHWREVWGDTLEYYHLVGRGIGHTVNFFLAFLVLGTMHEFAHGVTAKRAGGGVHRMGAMLIYMAPCVFCDVSEAWVYGGRKERILTIFWGVWSEVVLCTYAAVVWWLTPSGTFLHQWAYLLILSGGIFCVLLNWNPLAKMDGYFMMTEYFRIYDVKVLATEWLLSWIRVRVFHMPGSVQPMSRTRAICYSVYAMLAGAYSYFLLLFFCRILYHILYYYTPQWAIVPAGLLAYKTFKGRLKKLGKFMKELYVDKKEMLRAHRKPIIAVAAGLLIFGLLPLRRETVQERFMLEPVQRAVLRAQVPGRVLSIGVQEGQRVTAGTTVALVHDLDVERDTARTAADYQVATSRAFDTQLRYADFGSAQQRLHETATAYGAARDKEHGLTVTSPISGVVITPRVRDLMGTYISAGALIAEVSDVSTLRARIFVPDHEMDKLQYIHDVALRMDSRWLSVPGTVESISPASQTPEAGLMATPDYQGIRLPEFFAVTVAVANPGMELRDGTTGLAKIHGRRRSILGIVFDPVLTAFARRLW